MFNKAMCTWWILKKGLMQERKQTVLAKGWVKKKKREKQEMGRGGARSAGLLVNQ